MRETLRAGVSSIDEEAVRPAGRHRGMPPRLPPISAHPRQAAAINAAEPFRARLKYEQPARVHGPGDLLAGRRRIRPAGILARTRRQGRACAADEPQLRLRCVPRRSARPRRACRILDPLERSDGRSPPVWGAARRRSMRPDVDERGERQRLATVLRAERSSPRRSSARRSYRRAQRAEHVAERVQQPAQRRPWFRLAQSPGVDHYLGARDSAVRAGRPSSRAPRTRASGQATRSSRAIRAGSRDAERPSSSPAEPADSAESSGSTTCPAAARTRLHTLRPRPARLRVVSGSRTAHARLNALAAALRRARARAARVPLGRLEQARLHPCRRSSIRECASEDGRAPREGVRIVRVDEQPG